MRNFQPKKKASGFALLFAIAGMLTLAIVSAMYLRNSKLFNKTASLDMAKNIGNREMMAALNKAREDFVAAIDPALAVVMPQSETPLTQQMNVWLTNYRNAFNAAHIAKNEHLEVSCEFQESGELREDCTLERAKHPKQFTLVYSMVEPGTGILYSATQQFQIAPATLNQFGYIIKDSPRNVQFGNITFHGPVVVFFTTPPTDPTNLSTGNFVSFAGKTLGTTFNGPLITNLSDTRELFFQPGAKAQIARAAFSTSKAAFTSTIRRGFTEAKIEALNGSLGIQTILNGLQTQLRTDCETAAAIDHSPDNSLCEYSYFGDYIFGGGGDPCHLQVVQKGSWSYRHGTYTAPVAPPTSVNIFNGTQANDNIFYIQGPATLSATAPVATLCAKQTFLADSVIINQSIVRKDDNKVFNSAIFADHDIVISDQAKFTNGISLPQTITNLGNTSPYGYPAGDIMFKLHISLISTQGNVAFHPAFYDRNGFNGVAGTRPVTLGTLDIEGLVQSQLPLVTSKVYTIQVGGGPINSYPAGFSNMEMRQDLETVSHPPPGIEFSVNTGLNSSVVSMTTRKAYLSDALKDIMR